MQGVHFPASYVSLPEGNAQKWKHSKNRGLPLPVKIMVPKPNPDYQLDDLVFVFFPPIFGGSTPKWRKISMVRTAAPEVQERVVAEEMVNCRNPMLWLKRKGGSWKMSIATL